MKIKYISFILFMSGFVFLQDTELASTSNPRLSADVLALSRVIEFRRSLLWALFSSIPLLNLMSENETLYIPAFGQIYNRKPLKAFIMMAMKSYWLSEYKSSKNDDIKDRNRSLWWLLILILYGMADAYVDAHLDKDINVINKTIENSYNGDIK